MESRGGPGARGVQKRLLGILGLTQVLSWGSLYYAFSILSVPVQIERHWSAEAVLGAFMLSIIVSGVAAPLVGGAIDRWGGRIVMALGSLLNAAGCLVLGFAGSWGSFQAGWILIGLGMAGTLYDAAFATIVRVTGGRARRHISYLSFLGGLASTVFWPLTAWLHATWGWHGTFLIFAALHVALCLPLHLGLPRAAEMEAPVGRPERPVPAGRLLHDLLRTPAFWSLALAFSANSFIFSALAIQLIPLRAAWGHSAVTVLWVTALVGPLQVLGRVLELLVGSRFPIRRVGLLSFALLPSAFVLLSLAGTEWWALVLVCCLYGLSNGLMTIVRGLMPRELFDPAHYGMVSGLLSAISVALRAVAPLIMGLCLQAPDGRTLSVIVLTLVSALSLLLFLAARHGPERAGG